MLEKIFKDSYEMLNPAQKKAVNTIEGPVMVVAGPGTGKTQILTLRIANILKKTDVGPDNILALTFTNSGVFSMRQRLLEIIGDDAYRVNIFTFHSFCENVIKNFPVYFPLFEQFSVIDDLEKVQILEGIIKSGDYEELSTFHDPYWHINNIKGSINNIKFEGLSPEEFSSKIPDWEKYMMMDESMFYKRKSGENKVGDIKVAEKMKVEKRVQKAREIADIFSKYQEVIKEKGLYDFSDMILLVLRELESNENLKMDVQEQYQYLLVDEHQDTNDGQNRLIELLTDAEHLDGRPNLFTVGDEKQSIYRFQGASLDTFKYFKNIYNDVEIINLEENYRSTSNILDSAHNVITASGEPHQELNSNIKDNNKVIISPFSNYKFELMNLADEISKNIESGVDPKDICVIYRNNKDVVDIKSVFVNKNIPYTILSKDSILDDVNISNLLNLIKVINNPNDTESLGRVLLINFLKLDQYDVVNILNSHSRLNRSNGINLFQVLGDEKFMEESGVKNTKPFVDFTSNIKELITKSNSINFLDFFKEFLEDIGYLEYMLEANDSRDQLVKIDKLFDEVKNQYSKTKGYNTKDFVNFVDSYIKYKLDIDNGNPEIVSGVQLITAHKSKGMEFEYVYIINAVRNAWEKKRGGMKISLPIESPEGDESDERRLFYVAMTRAKKNLHISYSISNSEGKAQDKSQFVSEIGEEYAEYIDTDDYEENNIDNLIQFIKPIKESKTVWDTNFLKELFLKKGLNVSALNNYVSCPKKYFFRNLIQLPSGYSPSLMFGNLIHHTLEKFFILSKSEEKILPEEKILEIFKNEIDNSSLFGKEYDLFIKRGNDLLSNYHKEYSKDWIFNVKTEESIKKQFVLDSGEEIRLGGNLDKIEYLDSEVEGKINIVDYKTGKPYSDKSKDEKLSLDRQIIFYHILLDGWRSDKYRINNAVLDFVEKNRKDEYEQKILDVSEAAIAEVKELINKVSEEIKSGEFLENGCGKKDCEWCR